MWSEEFGNYVNRIWCMVRHGDFAACIINKYGIIIINPRKTKSWKSKVKKIQSPPNII